MASISPSELNLRSAHLADTVIEILRDGDHPRRRGVVYVCYKYDVEEPLATRSVSSRGLGAPTDTFYHYQKDRLAQAKLQATFAKRTTLSIEQQAGRMHQTSRSSPSYGVEFPFSFRPSYAHDTAANLTVVTLVDDLSEFGNASVSEKAIEAVNDGYVPRTLQPAVELVGSCLDELVKTLPRGRSAVCILGHQRYVHNHCNDNYNEPVVICSQARGDFDPGNYGIVAAKARTVAITRRPSNAESAGFYARSSQIEGAIPVMVDGIGEYVLAAGGLPEGSADVAAIDKALSTLPPSLVVVALKELSPG